NLRTVLNEESIALHLQGKTKDEILRELLGVLVRNNAVSSFEKAYQGIMDRENKMSTGMKHGIALPHGKTDAVSGLVACVGVSDYPIDYETLDGKPCRIFILMLSPPAKHGPHLQFLAEVSLLFRSAARREALLAAENPGAVLRALSE
ncbi:MAG TPA: PTS sugar transporter subunit IIA, partial [Magnetospirillaceae bacterium]|nr:PTS sugar transporter subunit IIA [Magnetospirillaceae bacterium]